MMILIYSLARVFPRLTELSAADLQHDTGRNGALGPSLRRVADQDVLFCIILELKMCRYLLLSFLIKILIAGLLSTDAIL